MEIYKIKISPEVLEYDIFEETYSGRTFGYYSGLTEVLSGGTNGSSLLTGLTIPILLKNTYHDLGFYDVFDGNILQENTTTNFIFSSTTTNPYHFYFYNTSSNYKSYTRETTYEIDWGDGNSETTRVFAPESVHHDYNSTLTAQTKYTITLKQKNSWGTIYVKKDVYVPYTDVEIYNPLGTVTFVETAGSWSGIPSTYNYIFTGDSENNIESQISSNYVQVPFVISGDTTSRIRDLYEYGYPEIGQIVEIYDGGTGRIDEIDENVYTAYTINDISYIDYQNGITITSIFIASSSGITSDMIEAVPITKNEGMINVIDEPQIYSSIYIERGKNSAFESFRRIGEIDNVEELVQYGYGYFNIVSLQ
jgi:hypothetical protein